MVLPAKMEGWLCPSDRHLALRAQLGTGWSFHTNKPSRKDSDRLTTDEQEHINEVIRRNERINEMEKKRVGTLVDRLENMTRLANGSGVSECLLCGQEFGMLSGGQTCEDCRQSVCSKCVVDTFNMSAEQIWLCKICTEKRELWKRSGAWFFKRLPTYVLPKKKPGQRQGMVATRRPGHEVTWTRVKARRSLTHDEPSDDEDETHTKPKVIDHLQYVPVHLHQDTLDNNQRRGSLECINCPLKGSSPVPQTNSRSSTPYQENVDNTTPTGSSPNTSPSPDRGAGSGDFSTLNDVAGSNVNNKKPATAQKSKSVMTAANHVIGQVSETGTNQSSDPDITFTSDFGQLVYNLHHDSINNVLHIGIERGTNLKAMDAGGMSDPYVKCHLLPSANHKTKLRTKTIHKCLNPVWNENLTYHGLTREDLVKKTLRIAVLDEDLFGFDWIGEHRYQLDQLVSDKKFIFNVPLLPRQPEPHDEIVDHERGKILLALRYLDSKKLLHVSVIRCAELASMDPNGYSDPYVKLYLKPDKGKNSKRKTQIRKQTLNPEFNEDIMYEVDATTFLEKTLEITVWDYDRATANDFIGGVQIGARAKGDRLKLWQTIFETPNQRFEAWHGLSDSLIKLSDS